jgi:hypothetical protein
MSGHEIKYLGQKGISYVCENIVPCIKENIPWKGGECKFLFALDTGMLYTTHNEKATQKYKRKVISWTYTWRP